QSLSEIIIHLVFSTKDREPLIKRENLQGLHGYLATLVRERQWECYRVGGVEDHVHLAIRQPRTENIADLVGHIKRTSTKWMHNEKSVLNFAWQSGYGAFSVSPPHLQDLLNYIENQAEHHKTKSFKDEYRAFLNKYHIPYDEKYVWD
ncbi:MAG: transposase, partial [Akkermansiaceae bacterium]